MTPLTDEEQKRLAEAIETTNYIVEESAKREFQQALDVTKNLMSKFNQIELLEKGE